MPIPHLLILDFPPQTFGFRFAKEALWRSIPDVAEVAGAALPQA